ncbi:guanylate kinase [bacterium]|jgi:guanylate kinase|nr:guanylate kinase [bacterium]MBT4552694.1 guanylate kinase [bacterium]
MKNIIAIITGPSAVGKTTIAKEVLRRLPHFKSTVTYTTRDKRDWSKEDKVINYVSPKKFKELIVDNQFIEWAKVYGNFYGTGKRELLDALKHHSVLLNIDVQGTKNIKEQFPDTVTLFIKPANFSELKDRITARPMPVKTKKTRLAIAKTELAQADDFDYQIINKNGKLTDSVTEIIKILKKY